MREALWATVLLIEDLSNMLRGCLVQRICLSSPACAQWSWTRRPAAHKAQAAMAQPATRQSPSSVRNSSTKSNGPYERGSSGPIRGPRHRLAAWWGVAALGAVCLPGAVACLLVTTLESVKWIGLGTACLAALANLAARRWVMRHRSEELTYDELIDKLMTRYHPVDVTAFQELQSLVKGTGFMAAPFRHWLEAERAADAGKVVVLRPPEPASDLVYTFTSRSLDDDYGRRRAA